MTDHAPTTHVPTTPVPTADFSTAHAPTTPVPTAHPRPLPPHALSFDRVAAQYATARPSYPPRVLDAVEELTGSGLRGARVLDVGAGTGIATRLLTERGAHVIAVEPGPEMGAQLREALPMVPLVRAVGDALPFADGSADLITYAQAWHWTDPECSVPEALRVLTPGGALAMWWNQPDPDVAWAAEQEARLKRTLAGYHANELSSRVGEIITRLAPGQPVSRRLHWTRRVPIDVHLAHLGSRSHFAEMGPERAAPVLAEERAYVLREFPDGVVEEAYALDLTVTLR
ncbi:class I SAM-dependent methyltransferase [Streptomyces apocyni]|uniref:class I SAM-dependent methyltransferase n=1 Tax=Streptomyces apocyni TaxID=2654677 RepID=UPI0012E9FB1A|nr:class I SAM-dependent methyltransferase [Streptomyces apocyni]